MIPSLLLLTVVGLLLIALGARLGRSAFVIGAMALAAVSFWLVSRLPGVVDGRAVSERASWVDGLGLSVDLRLDGLAATMSLIVAGVGVLVLVYAATYFSSGTPDVGRLAGLLVLFAGAMIGLVQADHLLLLYTCWELTSVTSYLLIGNQHTNAAARAAALQALLVTSTGGLAMLAGFVVLGREAGTYRLSELAAGPVAGGTAVTIALVLILVGAFTKSAQFPFHAWLPAAMAAPTPVSAYLHSATMVKAGVYLIARLAPLFALLAVWRPLVLTIGIVTMFVGGLRALRQNDLKLLLASGTVSQLGLMVVLFGAGTPAATTAGWALLVAHALFKGALFMVVGVLDRCTGTRDIRKLPPLGPRWWWVGATTLVSAASMAGVPLFAGFVAKESAYTAFSGRPFGGSGVVLAAVVCGSMLTVAYSARFYWCAFVAPRRAARTDPTRPLVTNGPTFRFAGPALGLAVGTVVLGSVPALADPLVAASVGSPVRLALWHGFNLPLALSALTLGGGALLVVGNRAVQAVLATGRALPSGEAFHLSVLRTLQVVSRRVTGVVQNGSLPVYSGVILVTASLLPAGAFLTSAEWPGWPRLGPLQDLPIAGVLVLGALGAATVRRRFSAVVFLGVAGYAMAALFVVYGAPDLALTQVVVETLTTVVFVLVLRRLPERFERQSTSRRRYIRLGVAGLVGVTVFLFAIIAAGTTSERPLSEEMVARSLPDGNGRNVVNVILVDFRGLDTLGEITVLAVASIGAVALTRVDRRRDGETSERTSPPTKEGGLSRIVFVDVSVQMIFHAAVMASLWLLFSGHNQPGGGFVGGLLAGSAITLRYVAGGITEVRGRSRFRPWTVLGTGLLLAAGTAAFPLLRDGAILDVATASLTLPLIGAAKLSSALVFDAGVYLTVVGMVLMAFEAFGDDPAEAFGDDPAEAVA